MPLRKDDEHRGAHAIHVKSHRKLAKHRTVIESAFELASWLVDQQNVQIVSFGRVVIATGTKFTKRAECSVKGTVVTALLVATSVAQTIRVTAASAEDAATLATEIKRQWMRGRLSLVDTS